MNDVSGMDIRDNSMSCLSCCLVSSSMKVPTQVCWVRSLLLSEYHLCPHSNSTMKDD